MDKISIFDFDDYRLFLKALLSEGTRKNPGFSLRALARLIGMSPSHLSRTISGQKSLSASAAHQISTVLRQTSEETDHFISLIELEKANNETKKVRILRRITQRTSQSRVLCWESFQVIADWYHFAILTLTKTAGFRKDPRWIAKRLGIQVGEAKDAIERLVSMGLLEKTDSSYRAVDGANITTTDDISSAAIQENHSQQLQKAERALVDVPVELREFNNLSLSMNIEDLPRAKKMIRDFVTRFNREMEREMGEEVFQINVQFYPLSKMENKETKKVKL